MWVCNATAALPPDCDLRQLARIEALVLLCSVVLALLVFLGSSRRYSGSAMVRFILWGAFAGGGHPMPVLGVVGLVVALLTAYYGGRLLFLTFFGESRVTEHARHHLHESPAVMTVPLIVRPEAGTMVWRSTARISSYGVSRSRGLRR